MSFKATNWALTIKGLKPATKIVLIYLSDRFNPDYGCFPSISKLAEDCEMSDKSVHTHLDKLEAAGLITKTARTKGNGIKTSNSYKLHMPADPDVKNLQNGYVKSTGSDMKNLHSNLVSNNHVKDNPKNMSIIGQPLQELLSKKLPFPGQLFDDLWKIYPKKVGKGTARKALEKALAKETEHKIQHSLALFIRAWGSQDKKFMPHLATWLNGERWDDELQEASLQDMTSDQQMQAILGSLTTDRKMIQ